MTAIFAAIAVALVGIVAVLAVALCRAAARGDEDQQSAAMWRRFEDAMKGDDR